MNQSSPHHELQSRFTELVDCNCGRWFGIARCYASKEDREDLLQEILLQVWKSLPDFRGESKIETWSYRVALNTALAWQRLSKNRNRKLPQVIFDVSLIQTNPETYHSEMKILDEFLGSLSKSDRAVMLMHLDSIPNSEAADILGISEGTYRVRVHRIKQKFESQYIEKEAR